MDAITTSVVAFLTGVFKIIFDILTPPVAGATPLQIIIYAGFAVGFLGAGVALIKGLAKG